MTPRGWLVAALLGGAMATIAYRGRALTVGGGLAAAAVGCIVWKRGGPPAAAALLAFFASSSALSRLGTSRKQRSALAQVKGARRDAWQVLANGGCAAFSIAFGRGRGSGGFVGALAAAGADTWATELGMLARRQPRLITSLSTTVERGTSGGVTPEGLAASVAGAAVVGLAWSCLGGGWRGVATALVAGVWGSLVDSWLGATLQAMYRCPACDQLTEQPIHARCGQPAVLVGGQAWATNDAVNALATLAGAIAGAICWPTR